MMSSDYGSPIPEIDCSGTGIPEEIFGSDSPRVLRGLVSDWPVVKAAKTSDRAFVDYLSGHYNQKPVNAFLAQADANGRIFYNENLDGFNFVQSQVYLDDALNKIVEIAGQTHPPTYYVGSLEIKDHLPDFGRDNKLDWQDIQVREGIWLGNQSVVAPHFDFPDNIACCVAGERRFRLFPPEQSENMYVGPLDFTPAGQPISLVDVNQPDLDKFPRFEQAMASAQVATLNPGDGIYIPSMWWHSVQGLQPVNGLVNYWWRETPAFLGSPNQALLHAILSIKGLPERQRKAWQNLFNFYVFDQPEGMYDHLPERVKQQQSAMTEITARKVRAQLINQLK